MICRTRDLILAVTLGLFSMIACSQETASETDNRTFVLVHGAWHGAWAYDALVDELEQIGHKVIAVDLPGHGLDSTPVGDVTLDSYAQKIISVIDAIETDVILVGHSMGGIAVSQAAEARPERLAHLVLIAAFMPRNGETMLGLASQDAESSVIQIWCLAKTVPSVSSCGMGQARSFTMTAAPT